MSHEQCLLSVRCDNAMQCLQALATVSAIINGTGSIGECQVSNHGSVISLGPGPVQDKQHLPLLDIYLLDIRASSFIVLLGIEMWYKLDFKEASFKTTFFCHSSLVSLNSNIFGSIVQRLWNCLWGSYFRYLLLIAGGAIGPFTAGQLPAKYLFPMVMISDGVALLFLARLVWQDIRTLISRK